MRKQQILNLFEENLDITIETCLIMKSNAKMLDMNLIDAYFKKKNIIFNDENRSFVLESAGIIFIEKESREEKCTYGGSIVFSEVNSICIANNTIEIINRVDESSPKVIIVQGSVISLLSKAQEILSEFISKYYQVIAINEAIKNGIQKCREPWARIVNNSLGKNEEYIRRNMWRYEKLMKLDEKNIFVNYGKSFNGMKNSFKGKTKVGVRLISSKEENSFKVILPGVW